MKKTKCRRRRPTKAELEMEEEEMKDAEYMSKIMGALKHRLKQNKRDCMSAAGEPVQQNLFEDHPRDPSIHIEHNENMQDNYQSTDPQVLALDEYLNSDYYKQKKIDQERNWLQVVGQMFTSYMICTRKATQWGNINLCENDWRKTCKCSERKMRHRNVVLVDILSKYLFIYIFC